MEATQLANPSNFIVVTLGYSSARLGIDFAVGIVGILAKHITQSLKFTVIPAFISLAFIAMAVNASGFLQCLFVFICVLGGNHYMEQN